MKLCACGGIGIRSRLRTYAGNGIPVQVRAGAQENVSVSNECQFMKIPLSKILAAKKEEIQKHKKNVPLEKLLAKIEILPRAKNFKAALRKNKFSIIAEIKAKSPSEGRIADVDLLKVAEGYELSKAAAVSVLTDPFFGGSLELLERVRRVITKPVLRKDFILDEYQIYEARAFGADAFLLIAGLLRVAQIKKFVDVGKNLSLHALVEVHSKEEIKKLPENVEIIGINHRNLFAQNYPMDMNLTEKLLPHVGGNKIVVAESGIYTKDDVIRFMKLPKIKAVLVGTSVMREGAKSGSFARAVNELIP